MTNIFLFYVLVKQIEVCLSTCTVYTNHAVIYIFFFRKFWIPAIIWAVDSTHVWGSGMGHVFAADLKIFSKVPQKVHFALRSQLSRSASRIQLWMFPEVQVHCAAPLGRLLWHPLWPRTAGSTSETPLSSAQSGGAAVRRIRRGHIDWEFPRLANLEKTLCRWWTCSLRLHHFGINCWEYAKL